MAKFTALSSMIGALLAAFVGVVSGQETNTTVDIVSASDAATVLPTIVLPFPIGGIEVPADAAPSNNGSADAAPEVDICRLPPMPENTTKQCLAFFMRWTYNATEDKCVTYVYGGCGGTANLFQSEADCKAACPKRPEATSDVQLPSTDTASIQVIQPRERSEVCTQKMDSGPCYGFMRKWGFNAETGRCEWFGYGGCQGNQNNFPDARSCQDACGGSEPLTDFQCDKSKCSWGLWSHYTIKKCKPVYERGECCPTRFECPVEAREPGCYYRGKLFPFGSPMPQVTEREPCQAGCMCVEHHSLKGVGEVRCASVECPDLFGAPGTRGCKKIYNTPNQCCASSYQCNETAEAYMCEHDGNQYLKGEKIFLSRESGKTCLCNEEFVANGVNSETACWGVECAWESVYQGRMQRDCTPVYFGDGGCPIDWVCPGDKGEKVDTLPLQPRSLDTHEGAADAVVDLVELPENPQTVEGNNARKKRAVASSENATATQLPSDAPPSLINKCVLPKAEGKCEAIKPSWYYNALAGACEQFTYGGCGGNENRFATKEECESACAGTSDGCTLEPERGRCRGRFPAWHFDRASGECQSFFYGGCGGNQNNFKTKELCQDSCAKKVSSSDTADAAVVDEVAPREEPTIDSVVHIPEHRAVFVRKDVDGFNSISNEEARAMGMGDSLPTIKFTDATKSGDTYLDIRETCIMPMSRGHCYGAMPRFYFNNETMTCQPFRYGGCGGNRNNFLTKEECIETCGWLKTVKVEATGDGEVVITPLQRTDADGDQQQPLPAPGAMAPSDPSADACSLPARKGRCRAMIPRFYFDARTGQCAGFMYGGCSGNANNFETLQQCQDKCSPVVPRGATKEARCYLPEEKGMCKAAHQRYLYDNELGRCRLFIYGGCRGNRNNFATLQACQAACGGQDTVEVTQTRALAIPRTRRIEDLEPCFQPAVTGPCRMYYTQYHYDSKEGKCRAFLFGGCLGNANRFPTREACENACEKRSLEVKDEEGKPLECTLGQEMFKLGTGFLPESNSCYQCRCATPPSLTCQEVSRLCPASPGPEYKVKYTPGKCCPDYDLEPEMSVSKRR